MRSPINGRDALAALARFATTYRTALAAVTLAVVAGTTLYRTGIRHERQRAAAEAAKAKAKATRDTIKVVEIRYRTDTLRYRQWRTRWDTVRQDVERWKHDTVEVVRFVRVADSTIRACGTALTSCERLRLLEQRRADLAEQQLRTRTGPSRTRRALELAGAAAAGVVAGRLAR